MMPETRKEILILLCGILIATATPLCHAQDPVKLFDVKMPQAAVSSASIPGIANTTVTGPVEVKPANKVSELPWYLKIIGWFAMDIARYNTEKQSDGRPYPLNNPR